MAHLYDKWKDSKMQTAIYMRVSTTQQASEGQSLDAQEKILKDYAASHPNIIIVDTYVDDGISGTKFDQRDELQRLLSDVKSGKIKLILFTKLDRFFRSVRHLMNTLDTLERYGCEWKAVQENHDNSSPVGKLSITIMAAFAQMESDMDSERIKDVMRLKKSKREWLNGHVPYGYRLVDKHAVPDPDLAPAARGLFEQYIKHNNISKLVRDNIHLGAPTTTRGMKILLRNRAYIGEAYGIDDYLEPLVDKDTFDLANLMLSRNVKSNTKRDYIFSGLVRCPVCGRRMAGATYPQKNWAKYVCNYSKAGQCDYHHTHGEKKIERFILSTYQHDLESRYLQIKSVNHTDNSAKVAAIYRKIDRLKELYVNELIDIREYKKDLESYKNEIKSLSRPTEKGTEAIERLLQLNVLEIYKTLSNAEKRRLWGAVIKSITPKDGSFFIEYM